MAKAAYFDLIQRPQRTAYILAGRQLLLPGLILGRVETHEGLALAPLHLVLVQLRFLYGISLGMLNHAYSTG
jgi:hypothetical protein